MNEIYLCSVALEKNRWMPGRIPTFLLSNWVAKALEDGFDGIELWENHYLLATPTEQRSLRNLGGISIFNTYIDFDYGVTDDMRRVVDAIWDLGAHKVKVNLGTSDGNIQNKYTKDQVSQMIDSVLKFSEMLPGNVLIMSECHNGSAMQEPVEAAKIFSELGDRFEAIVHLPNDQDYLKARISAYGKRISHIHTQFRPNIFAPWPEEEFWPLDCVAHEMMENMKLLWESGFKGNWSIEFCSGSETVEHMYEGAKRDLKWLQMIRKDALMHFANR